VKWYFWTISPNESREYYQAMENTTQRLTEKQAKRLRSLLAYGPDDRRPVDAELIELGWAQNYDDDPSAIEAADGAEKRLYDDHGQIKDELLPLAWLAAKGVK
jgi:FMN phosphatase YigB (HAD superfamily)